MTTSNFFKGVIIAAALVLAPVAIAGPSLASPEMKTAFTKAAQGPEQLRRYVDRTKAIYMLDYYEVKAKFQLVATRQMVKVARASE
jgi:hypothetical protein